MSRFRGEDISRRRRTSVRRQVLERYGYTCHLCAGPIDRDVDPDSPESLTLDHLIPADRGGEFRLTNLRPAHRRCNMDRSDAPLAVGP